MPTSLDHQERVGLAVDLERRSVAGKVRAAVASLNSALADAAKYGLSVELHTIHHQNIDERHGRNIYSATIERREPL